MRLVAILQQAQYTNRGVLFLLNTRHDGNWFASTFEP